MTSHDLGLWEINVFPAIAVFLFVICGWFLCRVMEMNLVIVFKHVSKTIFIIMRQNVKMNYTLLLCISLSMKTYTTGHRETNNKFELCIQDRASGT